MKYVLDSSVALKWPLPEPDTPKALHMRAAYRKGLYELVAPDFFPIETAHALTRAERQRAHSGGKWLGALAKNHGGLPRDAGVERPYAASI